jgi:hypothetical protein
VAEETSVVEWLDALELAQAVADALAAGRAVEVEDMRRSTPGWPVVSPDHPLSKRYRLVSSQGRAKTGLEVVPWEDDPTLSLASGLPPRRQLVPGGEIFPWPAEGLGWRAFRVHEGDLEGGGPFDDAAQASAWCAQGGAAPGAS